MRNKYACILFLISPVMPLGGCNSLYYNVSDAGASAIAPDILKSIRCEVVSFLSVNYQKSLIFADLRQRGSLAEAISEYPYSNIDRYRYAGLEVRLLDTNNFSAGFGLTRQSNSIIPNSPNGHSFNFGPSLGLTSSYGRTQVYALPQHATLGPDAGRRDVLDQIYDTYPSSDSPYFCYKPIEIRPNEKFDRIVDLQLLTRGQKPGYDNFQRITVNGSAPLSYWLETIAAESATNNLASVRNMEGVLTGQLSYSFSIEIKPSIEFGYTLIATPINPFTPNGKLDFSNKSTFTLWLNQKDVVKAFGGQSGSVEIDDKQKKYIPQTP